MKLTKQQWINRGKSFPQFEGFVCLGNGNDNNPLREVFGGVWASSLNTPTKQSLSGDWDGSEETMVYYLPEVKFNELMKEHKYKYGIQCFNKEHFKFVQEILFARGFDWVTGGGVVTGCRDIIIDGNGKMFVTYDLEMNDPQRMITIDDILREDIRFKPDSVKVKLNESHTAEVFKDKIKVGCQTFPVTIVEDLRKALSEL